MGLLDRLRGGRRESSVSTRHEATAVSVSLLGGQDDLEVVGELAYQDALWRLSGGSLGDRIRRQIVAVLVPEPTNPYDANAIAVQIDGQVVGYLPRATAQEYLPGLQRLMSVRGGYVALRGVIVGGGYYDDGPGRLGVWLEHDPADFGIRSTSPGSAPPGYASADGVMRTGFTEAWLTDAEDDSYDLSWFNELPEADRPAIAKLRELLAADPDPIDRHFQFAELEARLYRSRDLYELALAEYDETCARHDAEMERICAAFMAKWGKIPLLDTYRQMAIRQQKIKDWQACQWWAERGLALYGRQAAREEPSRTSSNAATGPLRNLKLRPGRRSGPRWTAPIPPSYPQLPPQACRAQPARMPKSKCLSARNATAASNACESAAVNRRSVQHAARPRKRNENSSRSCAPRS
jgi:hypothetical protein